MKEIKTVAMVGCGAVGALYGIRLWKHLGADFQIVASGSRKERYERDGFVINNELVHFPIVSPEALQPVDFFIFATKNLQLETAIEESRKAIGPSTIVLSLLNGIDSEYRLAEEFGKENVLFGFCVGMSSVHVGNHIDFSSEGSIVFGDGDNRSTLQVKSVATLLEASGISHVVPQNIRHDQWKKFMMNTAYNTLSSICRAGYGVFAGDALKKLVWQVNDEVQKVAAAEGVILTEDDKASNQKIILSIDPMGKTSMYQDMEAGRPTENNWFCGTVVRLGEKHGLATPVCATLNLMAQACEDANQARREQQ
ncbi:MAG: ketopantoate reductase family protein [Spirochaetia bacterium]|jgi:2-dehydropantoate 2-reductase|nr:ketopantoate reductase family protein [Spirochaetia bacterium]